MHREAEGQERAADGSSGAKEGRVGADERGDEQTGGRLLGPAGGTQTQVRTHRSGAQIQENGGFRQSLRNLLTN